MDEDRGPLWKKVHIVERGDEGHKLGERDEWRWLGEATAMVDGDPASPLIVIGMAPGREELANGRPFVGGSGKLLWKQLAKKAGISRADCYIVNTIGEWPEGSDGNPTKAQFDKWWGAFDEAVSLSTARAAFLLGGAALYRFTGIPKGPTGIEEWRGYCIERSEAGLLTRTIETQGAYKTSNKKRGITKGDPRIVKTKAVVQAPWPETVRYAIPSIHPAAILRTGLGGLPALASDSARVGRAVRGELNIFTPEWMDHVPSSL